MTNKVDLEQFALKIRRGIVDAIAAKGGGHIGGSLDLAELLSVLYSNYMRVDPANPDWDERDFLICSKGHAGPALYATLALKGFFPYETLLTLNQEGSMLPGHCDRCKVPGVDATSGSLGQGLSIACGLALSSRLRSKNQRVFCVIGDGEAAEGQIWEAAQFASHFELDNLILFLDWNKMQIDGPNDKVMSLGDPVQKFQSFGWRACKVEGDNVLQLDEAISTAINLTDSKPHIIVLDTVKGGNIQCVSSLANNHCIGFSNEMYEKALKELDAQASDLERGVR